MALDMPEIGRRTLLLGGGLALVTLLPAAGKAAPEAMAAAMRAALGTAVPQPGRIKLDIPAIAENGNSVPMTITVDSPMTAADHVKTIYVFSEHNPLPDVARFRLGARAGRARVQTSIRLAATQFVTAVAAMSDGGLWSARTEVVVTLAACLESG